MSRAQIPGAAARRTGESPEAAVHASTGGFHSAQKERERFDLELGRSLSAHRGLFIVIALLGVVLSSLYLWRFWPVYSAQALVFVQPAPAVDAGSGVAMHWPYNYDPATYDSYLQQQMLSVTSSEVLRGALGLLRNFQRIGESEQAAMDRLARSISVARVGKTYEIGIRAQSSNPQIASDVANAVAASYVENTAHEQQSGDAARIELLRSEEVRVKGQLQADRAERAGSMQGAAERAGRAADLDAEIARLQKRFDDLDGRIQNLTIEDAAPGVAHVSATAEIPAHPVADGVVPRAALMLAAFLLAALLAAMAAQKLDQKVYAGADVERLTGFSPVAELPDSNEVSEGVFEEQVLRLSAAVESVIASGRLRCCVFTGTGAGTGVSTIVARMRSVMEGMGRNATLLETAGGRAGVWPGSRTAVEAAFDGARPMALMQKLAEEAGARGASAILADAAPLRVSAETEYLARNADCVVVVIESGVTTRQHLRATAKALQKLNAGVVGYVLNRVALSRADASFRDSLLAIEEWVRLKSTLVEEEPVRTRRVEVRPARDVRPAVEETEEPRIEPEERPVEAQPEPERPVRASMAMESAPMETAPGAVRPQETVAAAEREVVKETVAAAPRQPVEVELPWWIADPILHPEATRKNAPVEMKVPRATQPAPEVVPQAQWAEPESRLSGLRKLFADKEAEARRSTPVPPAGPTPAVSQRGRITVPEPIRNVTPKSEPPRDDAEAARRMTPEVIAIPEFLPPRKSGSTRRDEDAASRRERRDTWDDVSVLPSWRGQYRRKD